MQNIDFYDGNNNKNFPPQYDRLDTEYFSRMASTHFKDEDKQRKKATRIISLIAALCIISFTTGLIIGIKFTSKSKKEIVDKQTYNAVANIKNQVTDIIASNNNDQSNTSSFPIDKYPYVIKIGSFKNKNNSQNLAALLSNDGHRVIISKSNNLYKLYTGPYQSLNIAKKSLQDLSKYEDLHKLKIFKRK